MLLRNCALNESVSSSSFLLKKVYWKLHLESSIVVCRSSQKAQGGPSYEKENRVAEQASFAARTTKERLRQATSPSDIYDVLCAARLEGPAR